MHGSFDRSGKKSNNRIQRSWSFGFFALPVLLAIALIALAIFQPAASDWISQAAQAEFAAPFLAPALVPTQLARPADEIRTVRSD
jgi:hypothetical protein